MDSRNEEKMAREGKSNEERKMLENLRARHNL
jgi:hypothetical protein